GRLAVLGCHGGPGKLDDVLRPIDGDGTVALLSNPSKKIAAKVREISPTIDSSTGTIKVKVEISSDAPIPLGAPVVGRFDYVSQDV
ncbi:HlyD family efflux transporter periplasmic adaptor subunit, partial [Rhizobium ruizarguesonis]